MTQGYRNARKGYLTDLLVDTTPIGSIVTNLKAGQNSYDHSFVKATASGYPSLTEASGNAYLTGDDPAYTHEGYLYCDGTEYNIGDYPGLYEIVGTKYGGRSSNGIDVVNGGSGYTTSSTVVITTAPTGGVDMTATVGEVDSNGKILFLNITSSGQGYTSVPTVSVTGGTGATFVVRMTDLTLAGGASLQPINSANVMDHWGDPYLGTFKVPDLVAKKIVGNGPVYGNNSPNVGNVSIATGATGGAWYLDKDQQDEYFSLGTIVTSGYDKVIETTSCTIIGSQDVTITMRERKLSGVPQHSHIVYASTPGGGEWVGGASGDRYLQDYRPSTGKVTRWYPTGDGIVMTHKHGLLRQPLANNTIATYDAFDFAGGSGGTGGTADPTSAFANGANEPGDYYLASGGGAGSYEFQTTIPNPISKPILTTTQLGGKLSTTGGTPIYDYSNVFEYTTPGTYTIDLTTITGTPDQLKYSLYGGGGSGAAGTQQGNNGNETYMKVGDGSLVNLKATGGGGGNGSQGLQGGAKGAAGTAINTGSLNAAGAVQGQPGGDGQDGQTGGGWPKVDYPNDPNGGGAAGVLTGQYADGSPGINSLIGGQSGNNSQTFNNHAVINLTGIAGLTDVTFELHGGKGRNSFYGNLAGGYGAKINISLKGSQLAAFTGANWSVQIGAGATSQSGAQTSSAGDGGSGGNGHNGAHGGGGGAATALLRNGTVVAGAGGGGGGGSNGYDGGAGTPGQPSPIGGVQETALAIGMGGGGNGGNYGCIGGGGGGGGGGCGTAGQTYNGVGNGGGSGGIGGGPGGDGGHGGGAGGNQGISSYDSAYFESGTLVNSTLTDGRVVMVANYNNDYWTPGGGGGGSAGFWTGFTQFVNLGNPASIEVKVGSGGAGVTVAGQTTGTTSNGLNGYAKVELGIITGYDNPQQITTSDPLIKSASFNNIVDDVTVNTNGSGTGTAGGFKLPTADPIVYIRGGGGTGATATPVMTNGVITGVTVTNAGSGYTETPYVHVLHGQGGGAIATATLGTGGNSDKVDSIAIASGSASSYSNYLLFGGNHNQTSIGAKTRWVELMPVDTSDATHFSIKAARGNGVNGGDASEESLQVYYSTAGSPTTWILVDTIIAGRTTPRTDPFVGTIPQVDLNSNWDGASGDTKWYTYTVVLPQNAKAAGTNFKIEQVRADASSTNDNNGNTDHFAICEFIWWNGKATTLVYVPTAGKMLKQAVDSLTYTIDGEVGPSVTYSSGLGCSDATMTLKATTKIEPQATIDPDIDVPLLTPYRTCKYLIKAY
tara:strand:+ start:3517 stop:7359 length:3843 start_codon:yes stop_codon:yes gene_type:complete